MHVLNQSSDFDDVNNNNINDIINSNNNIDTIIVIIDITKCSNIDMTSNFIGCIGNQATDLNF